MKMIIEYYWGRRDRDYVVVGFTYTYAVSLSPAHGGVYSI